MKVLVVEDNVKLASYIVKMLEDENYSVEHLTNGFVAEQVIKKISMISLFWASCFLIKMEYLSANRSETVIVTFQF